MVTTGYYVQCIVFSACGAALTSAFGYQYLRFRQLLLEPMKWCVNRSHTTIDVSHISITYSRLSVRWEQVVSSVGIGRIVPSVSTIIGHALRAGRV